MEDDPAGERRRDRDDHALARARRTCRSRRARRSGPGRSGAPAPSAPRACRAAAAILIEISCAPPSKRVSWAPPGGVEVALEGARVLLVARRGDVEERVSSEISRGSPPKIGSVAADTRAMNSSLPLVFCAQPGVERLRVPLAPRFGCVQGLSTTSPRPSSSSCATAATMSGAIRVGRRRAETGVFVGNSWRRAVAADEDVVAGVVGREGRDPELLDKRARCGPASGR